MEIGIELNSLESKSTAYQIIFFKHLFYFKLTQLTPIAFPRTK